MTTEDEPPFYYTNHDGKFVGLDVDIAKAIAEGLGVQPVFDRSAASFNDLVPIVVSGKADAAISKLSITLSRALEASFSHPYIVFHQALILNRLKLAKKAPTNADIINFIKNFNGKIGVITGSSYVAYAKKNFPHAAIEEFPTWEKVVNAVFAGSILAGYRDEMEIKKIIRGRADSLLKVKTIVLKDTKDNIGIAVAPQNTHLLYWINLLLDRLNLNLNADKLLDRYPDIFKSGH
jgi:ABC-type amino acid transport substrate-binding protein